jgi:hypothetical protein
VTHYSRDQLVAWRDHPTEEARAVIVPHLARCGRCAAQYAELMRTRPATAADRTLDPADFLARGVAAYKGQASRRWAGRRWIVPLAAVASLVLVVFALRPDDAPEPPVLRGGAGLEAIAPAGPVASASEFTWSGPAETSFRLEISDPLGAIVHEARVRGSSYTLPPDVRATLMPGVEYQWTVARLDARGDTIDVSAPARFTIRR